MHIQSSLGIFAHRIFSNRNMRIGKDAHSPVSPVDKINWIHPSHQESLSISLVWDSYWEFGIEGDEKNLGYLNMRSSWAAHFLNHGKICTSTYLNLAFIRIIITSYPFLFIQRHAYLLPSHTPRSWKSRVHINTSFPQISPSILETEMCNPLPHRGTKPKY